MNTSFTESDPSLLQGFDDPLLRELMNALRRGDTSDLALSLCDEMAAKSNRAALRNLIRTILEQLVPVATEATAGLICCVLGLTAEPITAGGKLRWKLPSATGAPHPNDFTEAASAYQAAVLLRFPRKTWEMQVDQGHVRTRYWGWALVQALESVRESDR